MSTNLSVASAEVEITGGVATEYPIGAPTGYSKFVASGTNDNVTTPTIATSPTPGAGKKIIVTDVWFGNELSMGAGGTHRFFLTDGTITIDLTRHKINTGQMLYIHFSSPIEFTDATAVTLQAIVTDAQDFSGGFCGFEED